MEVTCNRCYKLKNKAPQTNENDLEVCYYTLEISVERCPCVPNLYGSTGVIIYKFSEGKCIQSLQHDDNKQGCKFS